jgi:hypothetical protein
MYGTNKLFRCSIKTVEFQIILSHFAVEQKVVASKCFEIGFTGMENV